MLRYWEGSKNNVFTCDNLTRHVVFFKHAFKYPHYLLLDSKLKLKSAPFVTQTDVHRYFDIDIYSIKLLCVSREGGLFSIQLFNLTSDLYYVQIHSKYLEEKFFLFFFTTSIHCLYS